MKRLDIESELLELGAPAGRQGYIQMVTALEFIMQHDDVMCAAANLYPYVAERLNTVPPRVERNIREEIYAIWSRGNQDRLNELFVNREKCPPGSKEFLYTLAHRLRHVNPGDYYIIKNSEPPSVILECGFLSNANDEALLQNEEHMRAMMKGAAEGILKYVEAAEEKSQ